MIHPYTNEKEGAIMGNIISILIQLVSGGLGGLGAGKVAPKLSLGKVGDVIAGIVGGGLGGQLLSLLGIGAAGAGTLDLASILTSILGGGVGGGVLMAIVAAVKKLLVKK